MRRLSIFIVVLLAGTFLLTLFTPATAKTMTKRCTTTCTTKCVPIKKKVTKKKIKRHSVRRVYRPSVSARGPSVTCPAPNVRVEAPNVSVSPPNVNVAAPNVNVPWNGVTVDECNLYIVKDNELIILNKRDMSLVRRMPLDAIPKITPCPTDMGSVMPSNQLETEQASATTSRN